MTLHPFFQKEFRVAKDMGSLYFRRFFFIESRFWKNVCAVTISTRQIQNEYKTSHT